MNFANQHLSRDREEYEQRIHELESELNAAHRLIVDQQQILKANLDALALEHEPGEGAPAAAPVRAPEYAAAYADQPPIRLPELGPPAVDIADRVLRAAADRGIADAPRAAAPRTGGRETAAGDVPFAQWRGAAESAEPRRAAAPNPGAARFPLVVTAVLLLGGTLLYAAWSHLPWPPAGAPVTRPGGDRSPAAAVTMNEAVSSPAAVEKVLSSPGPVLEPVTTSPARAAAQRPRARHVVADALPATTHNSDRSDAAATARQVASISFHRHARKRRRIPSAHVAAGPAGAETRGRPAPGWDEQDDKWLDRF
jgi:hypothetical protein